MLIHARAILWAQVRTVRNFYPRGNLVRLVATVGVAGLWYAVWTFGAVAAGLLLAETEDPGRLDLILSRGMMAAMAYWQLMPILMVSAGASLDLKRLRVYPIPRNQLFGLEVLLRLSTGVEMLLVLAGAAAGLYANPTLPRWAPLGLLPFGVMNLFFAAGLRNLIERLLARKHVREIAFLLLVTAAALPQLLLLSGVPIPVRQFVTSSPEPWLPWSAGASAVLGVGGFFPWITIIGWALIAYSFGRWQFERGLRFDYQAADVRKTRIGLLAGAADRVFRLPPRLFRDPIGALVEKEMRTLFRAPRFRIVFVMGFTFGLIIWLPIAIRGQADGWSFLTKNYLTIVSLYALLLLGEVSFWNAFGFDRSAAQIYFLFGVPFSRVVLAKNISAVIVVWLEVTAVATACFLLRMPVRFPQLAESYLVTFVLALYMLSVGNLGSTRYPRPVDPRQSWRSTAAGKFQAMLLFIYPIIALPVLLAFLARYALESDVAFYGVLIVVATIGALIYRFALQSTVGHVEGNRERMLAQLSVGEGPVSS
jgi:ABC-2 type transport system permease protein